MKIVETHDIDKDYGKGSLTIEIIREEDGEVKASKGVQLFAGEPEDATFNRDLSDAYSITDLINVAYQAGKKGIDVEFEFIDEQAPSVIERLRELCGDGDTDDEKFEEIYEDCLHRYTPSGFSASVVDSSFEEGGRWSNYETTVYEVIDGEETAYFEVEREVPATESQDGMNCSYSLREVVPKEVTVIQYV